MGEGGTLNDTGNRQHPFHDLPCGTFDRRHGTVMALIIFKDRSCIDIPEEGWGIDYLEDGKPVMVSLTPAQVVKIIRDKDLLQADPIIYRAE